MLNFFRFVLLRLLRKLYRVKLRGSEHLPAKADGGALLVANHATWIDAFLLSLLSERQIRFVIYEGFLKVRAIGWFIRMGGAVPISQTRPRDAIRVTAQAIADGDLVCLFPEGQLSRSGLMTELQRGIELIARQSKAPVIPVYMDGLWGSIFSFERGRYFRKWPRRVPYSVSIVVGQPLAPADASTATVRHRLQTLAVEAVSARPELARPLPVAILEALKRRPGRPLFIEHSKAGGSGGKSVRKVSRAAAIAAAIALASRWRDGLPADEKRIGILLPGGAASGFMNLGLVLAGRVPVNLPFGGDPRQLAAMLEQLGIRTVMTSRAFAPVLESFPWRGEAGHFIDLRAEIDAAGSMRMLGERVKACFEPKWLARRRLGFDDDAGADIDVARSEAYGYVWLDDHDELHSTFLSHFDVQAGVVQLFNGQMLTRREERIFCEQPMSSAVGSLFALWAPVFGEAQVSGRSAGARADAGLVESVLSAEKATLLISSAQLLETLDADEEWHPAVAGHLQRIFSFAPEIARSGAAGAAKWNKITAVPLLHGWAPDAIGRVISLSLPDSPKNKPAQQDQPGCRAGSAGRLLPGVAPVEPGAALGELSLRLPSPDGGEMVASGQRGTIDDLDFVFLADSPEPAP